MKLKKIVAAVAATAVALSAMAVNAFAATFEGTHKMTDSSWWTQDVIVDVENGVGLENLIGNLDPSTVKSVTFKSDTTFIIGYNTAAGEWFQSDNAGVTEYTMTDFNFNPTEDVNSYLHLCISKGDGVEYTITWTAEGEELSADAPADEAADDEVAAGEGEIAEEATDDESADAEEAADETEEITADEETTEETADEEAAAEEETTEAPEDEAAPAETEAAADAPASDTNTSAAATGNVAVASIAAVMAVAGVAAVASRKRK